MTNPDRERWAILPPGVPNHVFTSTRKLPLGEPDPSLYFCDDCGHRVGHPIHQKTTQADRDRELFSIIEGGS